MWHLYNWLRLLIWELLLNPYEIASHSYSLGMSSNTLIVLYQGSGSSSCSATITSNDFYNLDFWGPPYWPTISIANVQHYKQVIDAPTRTHACQREDKPFRYLEACHIWLRGAVVWGMPGYPLKRLVVLLASYPSFPLGRPLWIFRDSIITCMG